MKSPLLELAAIEDYRQEAQMADGIVASAEMSLANDLHQWIADIVAEQQSLPMESHIYDDELACLRRALALVEEVERMPEPLSNRLGQPDDVIVHIDLRLISWATRLREMVR